MLRSMQRSLLEQLLFIHIVRVQINTYPSVPLLQFIILFPSFLVSIYSLLYLLHIRLLFLLFYYSLFSWLQQIQKGIDDLKKTMDRLRQREKQIIKEAGQAEVKNLKSKKIT